MKHVWSLRHQEEQENINEIEDLGTSVDEPTSDQPLSGCVTGKEIPLFFPIP